jgi:hypothetical protein
MQTYLLNYVYKLIFDGFFFCFSNGNSQISFKLILILIKKKKVSNTDFFSCVLHNYQVMSSTRIKYLMNFHLIFYSYNLSKNPQLVLVVFTTYSNTLVNAAKTNS